MGQSLQPIQNEQSQSFGGFPPRSCSECQAGGEAPKAVFCQYKLNYVHPEHRTVCYITTGTVSTCTGRKRRAISFEGASSDESELQPTQLKEDVQSSKKDGKLDREGRFLLYWITTTSISTSTSFTTTFSVFSVSCTPSGASACG